MAYTNNPNLPLVRMKAIELIHQGWSVRQAAKHFGFAHNTILNWLKKKPVYGRYGRLVIATESSRPHSHPKALSQETINRILALRRERNQCSEILTYRLSKEGILVSLSSVKRILKRYHLTKFSRWKKWHQYPPKPLPLIPGTLVELNSILDGQVSNRLSVYALIDTYSRWAFAQPISQPNSRLSAKFVRQAQKAAPFRFLTLQSDHGSEFSKWFTKVIEHQGMRHRHSRIRKPTDNGHVERFNQTLQKECLYRIPRNMKSWQKEIPDFIRYYNYERPHMSLDFKTPMQVVRSY